MNRYAFDFAIFGDEPLAWLLAGLLAIRHRRSVVLAPGHAASFGLQRSFDLSVAPITRPETWALLRTAVPETAKLLISIGGRSVLHRIDPIFFAETAAGRKALGHVEHMAEGFGHQVERLGRQANSARAAARFSDAVFIDRARLAPALRRWVANAGVKVAPSDIATFDATGGASIEADQVLSAARSVLVGSEAVLRHGGELPPILRAVPATAVLTEPNTAMQSPYMHELDTGVILTQPRSKAIVGVSPGTLPEVLPQIGRLLSLHEHLRLAGRSEFRRLITTDGAGYFGKTEAGPDVILGADATTAFLAPALARWLAGSPTTEEAAYFAARGVRDPNHSRVAEFSPELA